MTELVQECKEYTGWRLYRKHNYGTNMICWRRVLILNLIFLQIYSFALHETQAYQNTLFCLHKCNFKSKIPKTESNIVALLLLQTVFVGHGVLGQLSHWLRACPCENCLVFELWNQRDMSKNFEILCGRDVVQKTRQNKKRPKNNENSVKVDRFETRILIIILLFAKKRRCRMPQ